MLARLAWPVKLSCMEVVPIDRADDPRLADYADLTDVAARRKLEGDTLFVAEGPTAIERLLASDHTVRSILIAEPKLDKLTPIVEGTDAPIYVVPAELMQAIVGFDLHRGAIAAAERRPLLTLSEAVAGARRIAVLEGLNDPENLGAIARSARALGIEALVLDPTCIDPYTRRTVRVSMGEILFLRWFRADTEAWPHATTRTLAELGFETWALTPSGERDIWELAVPDRLALALGAEGPGLGQGMLAAADHRVRLPIHVDVDSLNVAAAAAVAFAITARTRRG